MSEFANTKPKQIIRASEKIGFQKRRQSGSHLILRHPVSGKNNNSTTTSKRYQNWFSKGDYKTKRIIQKRIPENSLSFKFVF